MNKTTVLLLIFSSFGSAVFAERQPFDRYQPIIVRQMFGVPPPGFDPTKLPSEVSKVDQKKLTKEQEQLKSAIHFSVINVTPNGETAVGFTDKSMNPTKHYYLKVGEERDGWKVKEADPAEASMTIVKDNVEVSLKIGGDSSKDAGATKKSASEDNQKKASSKEERRKRRDERRDEEITEKVNEKVDSMGNELIKRFIMIKESHDVEAKEENAKLKAENQRLKAVIDKSTEGSKNSDLEKENSEIDFDSQGDQTDDET